MRTSAWRPARNEGGRATNDRLELRRLKPPRFARFLVFDPSRPPSDGGLSRFHGDFPRRRQRNASRPIARRAGGFDDQIVQLWSFLPRCPGRIFAAPLEAFSICGEAIGAPGGAVRDVKPGAGLKERATAATPTSTPIA